MVATKQTRFLGQRQILSVTATKRKFQAGSPVSPRTQCPKPNLGESCKKVGSVLGTVGFLHPHKTWQQ